MLPKYLAIGFDLDGTLVDSLDFSAQWMAKAASIALGQPVSEELVRSHFGKPELGLFHAFLKPAKAEQAFAHYQKILLAEVHQMKLYPGATELLEYLAQRQMPLAIFTSRGTWATEQILRQHDLVRFFSIVLTGEQVEKVKPHPEGIHKICSQFEVAPQNFLFLGDSPADVQAAESAGARGYQALWANDVTLYGSNHLRSLEDVKSLLPRL